MRNAWAAVAVMGVLAFTPLLKCQDADTDSPPVFSPDQLDNMLAPIALYPDPLLAQVLVAATLPDQIDEAARFVRADSNTEDIDGQNWDVSVKAVAHYPTVLNMMADQLDWTSALGQAYVNQNDDVMASIQRLRAEAQAAGNLDSNGQMQVTDDDGAIDIWPEEPTFIFVPEYDPSVVYTQRVAIYFGSGYRIGSWLNYDFDWRAHRVIYQGWQNGKLWNVRSRPYITLSSTYVNDRYRNIPVNREVNNRAVNYSNLNRYDSVHHEVSYQNVRGGNRASVNREDIPSNKVIQRNINTSDSILNNFRGRSNEPAQAERPSIPEPRQETPRPIAPPRQENPRPIAPPRQENPRQEPPRQVERPPSAFGGNQGGFNARESSQRGQSSRQEAQRPAPAPRPSPPPRSAPESRPAPAPAPAEPSHSDGGRRK